MAGFTPILFGVSMSVLDVIMMSLGKFAMKRKIGYGLALTIATLAYSLEPYLFFTALQYESLTAMNLIWDLSSDILVTLVGIFYFKESIKGLRWLAVLFAVFSIILFAYTHD